MTALDRVLLLVIARSPAIKLALRRWALRYAARVLRQLGSAHEASADTLQVFGQAPTPGRTTTVVGIFPRPRRPRALATPQPPLPKINQDRGSTRPYLTEEISDE